MKTKNNLQEGGAEQSPLRGRVFHKIREDILKGRYESKEAIKENDLANELGVSRTPIREAMRQLELEGLVTSIPNRGVIVNGIDTKDIEDIYAIRSLIEGLAMRWATKKITQEQIDELEEIIVLSEFHLSKGHADQLYLLDNKFHERIYEISGSRILRHVLSDFHHYVQRVRRAALEEKERAKQSILEHKKIVEAMRAKDCALVESLASEHLCNIISNVKMKKIVDFTEED